MIQNQYNTLVPPAKKTNREIIKEQGFVMRTIERLPTSKLDDTPPAFVVPRTGHIRDNSLARFRRVAEADVSQLYANFSVALAARFPNMDPGTIPMLLRALIVDRTAYLICTENGIGLAQTRLTTWNPRLTVEEIFTVETKPAERKIMLAAMHDWAKSINAESFTHNGGLDVGDQKTFYVVAL